MVINSDPTLSLRITNSGPAPTKAPRYAYRLFAIENHRLVKLDYKKYDASFGRGIEIIVGRVIAFGFGVTVRLVASHGGRFTTVSVDALNGRHVRE